MPVDHNDPLEWVHGKDRKALKALMRIYGDDVSTVLNALHAMAARIAIGSGVEPDAFAQGVRHHWDFIATELHRAALDRGPLQ
jgi:hypothetical protein